MSETENKHQGSQKRPFLEVEPGETEEILHAEEDIDIVDITASEAITVLHRKVATLEKELNGRNGIDARLMELEAVVSDLTNDLVSARADNRRLQEQMRLTQSVLIKKDKEIQELISKAVDQKSRSMRSNLLLHNIPEHLNEDCESLFRTFLTTDLLMEKSLVEGLKFEAAHRVGAPRTNKSCRPIVIRFLSNKDKEVVLQEWYAQNPQRGPYEEEKKRKRLTKQVPPEFLQTKALNYQLVENAKAKAPPGTVKHKFQGDHVYINNQLVRPLVKKLSVEDVFKVDSEDLAAVKKLPMGRSQLLMDRGSSFGAHVFATDDINSVRKAYKSVVADPKCAKASHNILAYSVHHEFGWEEDMEFGAGRFLKSWMDRQGLNNMAIIITRQYGGTHLGIQRFENMVTVAKEAIAKMKGHM